MAAAAGVSTWSSPRPEPSEDAGRQKSVNERVDRGPHRGGPRTAVPDGVLPESESVSNERGAPREAKHRKVVRSAGKRPASDVSREDSDDDQIGEPLPEAGAHVETAAHHRHDGDGPALEFFLE